MDFLGAQNKGAIKFTPAQSGLRAQLLQVLCSHFGDGKNTSIVILPGVDGKYNSTSQALIKYLFLGFSGSSLRSDSIEPAFESLENSVVIISAEAIQVYYSFESIKLVREVVSQWPNLQEFYATAADIGDDVSREELYKVKSFVTMLAESSIVVMTESDIDWSASNISGVCNKGWAHAKPLDASCAIETWPLVQAYGLDDLNTGGFLTSKLKVVDGSELLHYVLRHVDSGALNQAVHDTRNNLAVHWDSMLRLIGHRSAARRGNLTEVRLMEPLLSFFEFGSIRNTTTGDDISTRGARMLFGRRSIDQCLESSSAVKIQSSDSHKASLHCTIQAEDPTNGIRVARSYMFDLGFDDPDAKWLLGLYAILCQVHRIMIKKVVQCPKSGTPYLRDESRARALRRLTAIAQSEFIARYDSMLRKLFVDTPGSISSWTPEVLVEIDSFDALGVSLAQELLAAKKDYPFPLRAFHYLKLSLTGVPSSSQEQDKLGALIIGDSIVESSPKLIPDAMRKLSVKIPHQTSDLNEAVPVVLTACIPLANVFAAANENDVEFVSNFSLHDAMHSYETSLGPKLPTVWQRIRASLFTGLYPEIGKVPVFTMATTFPATTAVHGHVSLFENGLVFESRSMGTYVLKLGVDIGSMTLLQLPSAREVNLESMHGKAVAVAFTEKRRSGEASEHEDGAWDTQATYSSNAKRGSFWQGPFKRMFDCKDVDITANACTVAFVLEDSRSLSTLWEHWKQSRPPQVECLEEELFSQTPVSQLFSEPLSGVVANIQQTRDRFAWEDCLDQDQSNVLFKSSTGPAKQCSLAAIENKTLTPDSVAIHLVVGLPASGKGNVAKAIVKHYQHEFGMSECELFLQDSLIHGDSFDVSSFRRMVLSSKKVKVIVVVCPGAMTTKEFATLVSSKKDIKSKVVICSCTAVLSAVNSYRDARKTQLLPHVQSLCAPGWVNTICITGCGAASSEEEFDKLRSRLATWNPVAALVQLVPTGLEPWIHNPVVLEPGAFANTLKLVAKDGAFEGKGDEEEMDCSSEANGFHSPKYRLLRSQHLQTTARDEHNKAEELVVNPSWGSAPDYRGFVDMLQRISRRKMGNAASQSLVIVRPSNTSTVSHVHMFGPDGKVEQHDRNSNGKQQDENGEPQAMGIRKAQQLAINKVRERHQKQLQETACPAGEIWAIQGRVPLMTEELISVQFIATAGTVFIQRIDQQVEKPVLLFSGTSLHRDSLVKFLEQKSWEPNAGKDEVTLKEWSLKTLTEQELEQLEQDFANECKGKELPSGVWFDGRNYINYKGEMMREHPEKAKFTLNWLREKSTSC